MSLTDTSQVLVALQGIQPVNMLDIGSGRGVFSGHF
jgi:hypothetical protein